MPFLDITLSTLSSLLYIFLENVVEIYLFVGLSRKCYKNLSQTVFSGNSGSQISDCGLK